MHLYEKEFKVTKPLSTLSIGALRALTQQQLGPGELPLRFVITRSEPGEFVCEIAVLAGVDGHIGIQRDSLFAFTRRAPSGGDEFNAVMIVPTGVDAEIGGHDGDAGPVAMLLASMCDCLITHPNVVNAADINELPQNGLYVEGSVICRFLLGQIGLQRVRSNRLLLVTGSNESQMFVNATINSANAARAAYGLECAGVLHLAPGLVMKSVYAPSGRATGIIERIDTLFESLTRYSGEFDAIAIASPVHMQDERHAAYFSGNLGAANPWGGVEAMLTHAISTQFDVSSAHAPMYEDAKLALYDYGIVDARKAAAVVSVTALQCVLKGLMRSPRIVRNPAASGAQSVMTAADVSCFVTPDGCIGLPLLAALAQGIPVIAVRENRTLMRNDLSALPWAPGQLHLVENYWEAAGVMAALKAGVSPGSVRRPFPPLNIVREVGQ
ncbi:DUF3326 domain-containing protein [Paraburkholderia fungorum]|uniref:DUF3326 domain-containing protein n=1 Tax=Paraburkholderia fungorum TaxID=134537 RepID=UPI0038B8178D